MTTFIYVCIYAYATYFYPLGLELLLNFIFSYFFFVDVSFYGYLDSHGRQLDKKAIWGIL